jgi:hypothetical protein
VDSDGNVRECGDAGAGPGRSFLFFLTAHHPGSGLAGEGVFVPEERLRPVRLRRPVKIRRREIARQVVLITAAGLQG